VLTLHRWYSESKGSYGSMTDRKARLAALAAKAGRAKEASPPIVDAEDAADDDTGGATTVAVAVAVAVVTEHATTDSSKQRTRSALQFRNYTPADPSLEVAVVAAAAGEEQEQLQQQHGRNPSWNKRWKRHGPKSCNNKSSNQQQVPTSQQLHLPLLPPKR
jgi:hypothetical protein